MTHCVKGRKVQCLIIIVFFFLLMTWLYGSHWERSEFSILILFISLKKPSLLESERCTCMRAYVLYGNVSICIVDCYLRSTIHKS